MTLTLSDVSPQGETESDGIDLREPADYRLSDLTSYLAAHCFVDRSLARTVLQTARQSRGRHLQPSYGVDVATVISAAAAADVLEREATASSAKIHLAGGGLATAFSMVLAFIPDQGATRAVGALLVYAGMWCATVAGSQVREGWHRRVLGRGQSSAMAFAIASFSGLAVAAAGASLTGGWIAFASATLLSATFFAAVLATSVELSLQEMTVLKKVRACEFSDENSSTDPAITSAIEWAKLARTQNLQIFDGYAPFDTQISQADSWAMTVDLAAAADESMPIGDLQASSVAGAMREAMKHSGFDGLRLQELAYNPLYNASHVPGVRCDAVKTPAPVVSQTVLQGIQNGEVGSARAFLRVLVEGERGLPTSISFVRVAVEGRALYLETTHTRGVWIDWNRLYCNGLSFPANSWIHAIRLAARAPLIGLGLEAAAPKVPYADVLAGGERGVSLLRLLPTCGPSTYFEQLDVKQTVEILDRSILGCLDRALTQANVNTAEFAARRAQIINNSTSINGGTFLNSALNVGHNNTAAVAK